MINKNTIGGLLLLLFSLGYGLMALQLDSGGGLAAGGFSPRTLPLILAVAGMVLSLLLMFSAPGPAPAEQLANFKWRPALLLCGMMLVYAAIFPYLGFVLATIVFLIGAMLVLGIRSPKVLLLAALPITAGFWLILNQLLGIYLAPGALFL
ncbi:tripartite tricarboxylate transporter TctB family protein [Exilibacterium tricleocarpae]|uniref:Tripartite tricarboxylate transporter TctB family protein n=1 Tax=Exilibacterium tricleocarpae TaxID=2591008 RepID=A0A545TAM9_9GAMM|nr:tripartite tricarboxylate transporter TctB family protein [Exilibacterium tricleocarpae]TQV74269.1 tripartite tricarboxylate transporter TctB family protein [Exilibacterium tricleocarpae]